MTEKTTTTVRLSEADKANVAAIEKHGYAAGTQEAIRVALAFMAMLVRQADWPDSLRIITAAAAAKSGAGKADDVGEFVNMTTDAIALGLSIGGQRLGPAEAMARIEEIRRRAAAGEKVAKQYVDANPKIFTSRSPFFDPARHGRPPKR